MRKKLLLILMILPVVSVFSQVNITLVIRDAETKNLIAGVTVSNADTKVTKAADKEGKCTFRVNENSANHFSFSSVNYKTENILINVNGADTLIDILLQKTEHEMEEVIISSSRTNSRVEDLPTKVEVLGSEELTEESGIKPGNIASLLGDIAGIQIQQTSASTGNADMRIQGVPGKYTQLLRDGLPLFGGYGGSFSILQIPPLDLQQIEMIKGASSTLYGGGAIAGMVNLISKKPVLGAPVQTFLINRSTLKENNFNAFFSGRNKKTGYTLFAGANLQNAVDVNKDGFSDVPDVKSIFIHPRLFLYHKSSSTVIGYTANYEDRNGGDIKVLNNLKDDQHRFFIQNKSLRNTVDVIHENKFGNNEILTLKASTSILNRDIITDVFGMKGLQTTWYSEAAYTKRFQNTAFVFGFNCNGEAFSKKQPDSSLLINYTNNTIGAFAQADIKSGKLTVQPGVRADWVQFDSYKKVLMLPRLSVMYKVNTHLTMRAGGGLGYKIPTPFTTEVDERNYHYLLPINAAVNQPEKSYGANADFNYKTKFDGWELTFNQAFFLTRVNNPQLLQNLTSGLHYFYINAQHPIISKGAESYIQLRNDEEFELYLGYTYTNAKREYNKAYDNLPLIARHKLSSVVAFEISDRFRAGIESSYTGNQFLDDGRKTPSYLFLAAMVRYNMGKISFVLNAENLLDYRQSKKEPIVFAPFTNPDFPEIWAPIDGRVINLSMTIKLK